MRAEIPIGDLGILIFTEREGGRRSYVERVETERVRKRKSFEVLKVLRRGDIFLHFKWNSSLEETSSSWNLSLLEMSSNFECPMPHLHVHVEWQKFKWNLSLLETSSQKRLSPSIVLKQCYLAK